MRYPEDKLGVHGTLRIVANPKAATPLVSDSAEEKVNDPRREINATNNLVWGTPEETRCQKAKKGL
jgi:hypothetical protein